LILTRGLTAALFLSLPGLAACANTQLPELTMSLGGNTTFGTDLRAEDPQLGITVIDPLKRLPG
jgi:hypothetical protein